MIQMNTSYLYRCFVAFKQQPLMYELLDVDIYTLAYLYVYLFV